MTTSGVGQFEQFRLTTLGGFTLWRHDPKSAAGWSDSGLGEKPCALLASLIWQGQEVPRSILAETFWEGVERGRARNSLRQALFRIRTILGPDSVIERPQGVFLTRTVEVDLPSLLPSELRYDAHASDGNGVAPPDIAAVDWLFELWHRSRDGVPVSAWMSETRTLSRQSVLDLVASRSVRADGRVARVRATDGGDPRDRLQRDLASVLWALPGAVGIQEEHRELIEEVCTGGTARSVLHWGAILDLIAAVAEETPLLLVLEDPERYSVGALRNLIAHLAAQVDCPVLLFMVGQSGARPASPLCFEMPQEMHEAAVR